MLGIISLKLMRLITRLSLLLELLPLFPISVKSSLFVLNNMGKELSINSDSTLDALQVPHPDGFLELLLTS